jgi:hypothetical protein
MTREPIILNKADDDAPSIGPTIVLNNATPLADAKRATRALRGRPELRATSKAAS